MQDNAGVIAPPPLMFLGTLALALVVERFWTGGSLGLPPLPRYIGGALLLILAVMLITSAFTGFSKAQTRVEPWRPTTALVTGGVYRFTRNPMYLGMTLAYAAVALLADSALALILLPPLLVSVQYGVIAREERYLARKFGSEYETYKASVRRWL